MCFLLMSYQHSKVLAGAQGFPGKLRAVRPHLARALSGFICLSLLNCYLLINALSNLKIWLFKLDH